jgi:hypothetical protein
VPNKYYVKHTNIPVVDLELEVTVPTEPTFRYICMLGIYRVHSNPVVRDGPCFHRICKEAHDYLASIRLPDPVFEQVTHGPQLLASEYTVSEYPRKCPAFFFNFVRVAETHDDTEYFPAEVSAQQYEELRRRSEMSLHAERAARQHYERQKA